MLFVCSVIFAQSNPSDNVLESGRPLSLVVQTYTYSTYTSSGNAIIAHKEELLFLVGSSFSNRPLWNKKGYNPEVLNEFISNCPLAKSEHNKAIEFFKKEKQARNSRNAWAIGIGLVGFSTMVTLAANAENPAPAILGGLIAVPVALAFPVIHFMKKSYSYYESGKSSLNSSIDFYNYKCD
jgi:hypothetical protein